MQITFELKMSKYSQIIIIKIKSVKLNKTYTSEQIAGLNELLHRIHVAYKNSSSIK